jgi:hypothetical protein
MSSSSQDRLENKIRREVQRHGFLFKDWVRNTFFAGYLTHYTQDWDVSKEQEFRRS